MTDFTEEETFDYPHDPGSDPTVAVTTMAPAPAPVTVKAAETPEQKRLKLMLSGDQYKQSPSHQTAALTWATVEVRDAMREQAEATREQNELIALHTEALKRQNDILDRQANLMEQQLELAKYQAQLQATQTADGRLGLQLAFYDMDRSKLDKAGVTGQVMQHLGIAAAAVAMPAAEPVTTLPEQPQEPPATPNLADEDPFA